MNVVSKNYETIRVLPKFCNLTHDERILASLKDVSPLEAGKAVTHLRALFALMEFREIVLSPFTAYPFDYKGETIDVPAIGQLRFNTEPEIWENCNPQDRFFSTSTLFRKEDNYNLLRRPAFSIIDFYQPGTPESMLKFFKAALNTLAKMGLIDKLNQLPFEYAEYSNDLDGPRLKSFESRWVITTGYDAEHSFFEIDEDGNSTRRELFLVTPRGFMEIAAYGIVGLNRNPHYVFRGKSNEIPSPPKHLSGMGFGLERLLLAEQLLCLLEADA